MTAKYTFHTLVTSCLAIFAVGFLLPNCSTKVGNPGNDNDQPDEALLWFPQVTKGFELPRDLTKLDNVDPVYQPVIKDILAVGYIASTIPASLGQFFATLAEKKFLANQTFTIDDQGRTLTGKTWVETNETGKTAGIWFCEGSKPVAYMTWGDESHMIEFTRDLTVPVLIADDPLVAGLDGKVVSIVSPNGSTLETYYTGQKRDPVTLESKDIRSVMQFSALAQPNGSYTIQGSGANQDEPTVIPTSGEIKAYGNFLPDATGQILIHLQGLCPAFQENDFNAPKWCVHSTYTKENVEVSEGDADLKWATLKNADVPLPKHEKLKIVGFPANMTCP